MDYSENAMCSLIALSFQNGTLIYGCRNDQEYLSDLNELAHHLKPFFLTADGLVAGPQCTKNILKELIHVLTSTLLSTSADSVRAGKIKSIPVSQGRNYCEASCFCMDFLRNGKYCVCRPPSLCTP